MDQVCSVCLTQHVLRSISRIVRPIRLIATPTLRNVCLTILRGQTNKKPRNHMINAVKINNRKTVEYLSVDGNSNEKSIMMSLF